VYTVISKTKKAIESESPIYHLSGRCAPTVRRPQKPTFNICWVTLTVAAAIGPSFGRRARPVKSGRDTSDKLGHTCMPNHHYIYKIAHVFLRHRQKLELQIFLRRPSSISLTAVSALTRCSVFCLSSRSQLTELSLSEMADLAWTRMSWCICASLSLPYVGTSAWQSEQWYLNPLEDESSGA
jgi:hypothetical protein